MYTHSHTHSALVQKKNKKTELHHGTSSDEYDSVDNEDIEEVDEDDDNDDCDKNLTLCGCVAKILFIR